MQHANASVRVYLLSAVGFEPAFDLLGV